MPQNNWNSDNKTVLATFDDGVLTLTMNRPEARNALNGEMIGGLSVYLEAAEADPEVRCIVLTGAGEKAFSAGGDVKSMASGIGAWPEDPQIDEAIHTQKLAQRAIAGRLHAMPKPTVAVINGAAAGAGLALALACDLRVMSTNAFLTTAFAKVGYAGDFGGTYFMTRLLGTAKVRELYFLSERVDAKEALGLGLANWCVEPSELAAFSTDLATRLANGPSVAYRYMKENINRAASGELTECLDLEAVHHIHCGLTQDHKNAVEAFVEKREPVFTGR